MRLRRVVLHTVINTLAIPENVWSLQKAALSLQRYERVPRLGVCDWRAWRGVRSTQGLSLRAGLNDRGYINVKSIQLPLMELSGAMVQPVISGV